MQKDFQFKNNCFDIIRLVSAIIILLQHTGRYLNIDLGIFGGTFGWWFGLVSLFTITGFLIPASLEHSKSNKEYLLKRFLRLYPELIFQLLLSLICVLILSYIFEISFNLTDILIWIFCQATFFQFYVSKPFKKIGTGNPNGALWTISMEIQFYVFVMAIWKWLKKRSDKQWLIMIVISMIINVVFGLFSSYSNHIVFKLINITFIPYFYFFFIGMFLYYRRHTLLPKLMNYFIILFFLYIGWHYFNTYILHFNLGHYTNIISGSLFSILTVVGSYYFGKISIKYEISYGIYIYHMIIVNIFYMFDLKKNPIYLLLVLFITILISWFSNEFIKKRFSKSFQFKKNII